MAYFGAIFSPISCWAKCENGEFLFAIRAQKGSRPDWRWVGRNFPRISQKSRTDHWELTGPSFWDLIAAKSGLFPGPLPSAISRRVKCDKNEAFLFALRFQKEGRPDWRWVGRNFHRIARKSRTITWALTGPYFWTLISAKDGPFFGPFLSPISGWLKCDKNEAFLFAIMAQKDGRPDWWWVGRNFPRISRKSRTNPWELMGPSSWALIAAKDGPFLGSFPSPISG